MYELNFGRNNIDAEPKKSQGIFSKVMSLITGSGDDQPVAALLFSALYDVGISA